MVTIFTAWKTMAGPCILTLPWTFYHSGLLLRCLICFLSFVASLRTCIIILRVTEPKDEFYDTVKKYWGSKGYYLCVVMTLIIC